jgi:Fic/DOC family
VDWPKIIRTTPETRDAIWRDVKRGRLASLGGGLYTTKTSEEPSAIVRRHIFDVLGLVVPGAVVSDRSAVNSPVVGDDVFVVHARPRPITVAGITIRPRKGAGPLESDIELPQGIWMASTERALVENMRESHARGDNQRRTLGRTGVEEWLARLWEVRGADGVNRLRDAAKEIAPVLGLEREAAEIDKLIGASFGTNDAQLQSRALRARRENVDERRVALFSDFAHALTGVGLPQRRAADNGVRSTLPFFEAYFSNYIEGTEFRVEEAAEIVFEGNMPIDRPQDAHDILGTYVIVSDYEDMSRVPSTAEALMDLLRSRHGILMEARPDKSPGKFKRSNNRAGMTEFVDWHFVEGTLDEAFAIYQQLVNAPALARAAFIHLVTAEVHPFADGNGRIARIMMNAELVAAGEQRIIIPTVYRGNYLSALRAATHSGRFDALIKVLDFAQRYTAEVDFSTYELAVDELRETNAFRDASDEEEGMRLVLPSRVASTR